MDKDKNGDNSKINSEVNRKTKLPKAVILRRFILPEHNRPSESVSCKTETKFRANIPAQLIQIPPQMTMTANASPYGQGSTLGKELEMIAMAH
ncbi:MAG: hypothetical protein EZS28_046679 [Streblomastix strix]|uniref:Uncharacterized protein n=1 Tax=Streblomastix strix TaxID=222440 RepID=A0A5J4THH5_9EUKA|nr:MAG: hypothetical protein EZS28_046679 [Streblomastix strix]